MVIAESPAQSGQVRVSVALCTYKPGRYLEEQLESIAAQTIRPDEIVLTDDSPLDSGLDFVLQALRRTGIAFKTERNTERLGVVRNFERAISLCSGDLIFLSDQDDVWASTKVAETLAYFDSHPKCLLAHSDGWITNEHLKTTGSLFEVFVFGKRERNEVAQGRALEAFHRGNHCTGAACAFRPALFAASRPFPKGVVLHDEWLALCAAAANRIGFIDSKLIQYRQHASNAVGIPKRGPSYFRDVKTRWKERASFHQCNITRSALILLAAKRMRRLAASGFGEDYARRKFEFNCFRAGLPDNAVARLAAIAGRLGDYSRLAIGWPSIAADCLLGGDRDNRKSV